MHLLCVLQYAGRFHVFHLFHLLSRFHHHHFIGKNTIDREVWGFCKIHVANQGYSQTWHPGPSLINKCSCLVGIKHPARHWENWNYWNSIWGWGGDRQAPTKSDHDKSYCWDRKEMLEIPKKCEINCDWENWQEDHRGGDFWAGSGRMNGIFFF